MAKPRRTILGSLVHSSRQAVKTDSQGGGCTWSPRTGHRRVDDVAWPRRAHSPTLRS